MRCMHATTTCQPFCANLTANPSPFHASTHSCFDLGMLPSSLRQQPASAVNGRQAGPSGQADGPTEPLARAEHAGVWGATWRTTGAAWSLLAWQCSSSAGLRALLTPIAIGNTPVALASGSVGLSACPDGVQLSSKAVSNSGSSLMLPIAGTGRSCTILFTLVVLATGGMDARQQHSLNRPAAAHSADELRAAAVVLADRASYTP
jgi:hypothetical protein